MSTNTFSVVLTVLLSVLITLFVCDLIFAFCVFKNDTIRRLRISTRKYKNIDKIAGERTSVHWDLVYEEENYEDGYSAGILSNGKDFLFTIRETSEGIETFRVYNSILCTSDTIEAEFEYSEENFKLLLKVLNDSGDDYCGAGSPLQAVKFK